ncbi:MAG TPA: AraC family transcriptional regulator [bacterium]|nr:AraC family transcriptional regulator [bacterium]
MTMRPAASRREYTGRINRVLDHISAHLDRELTLDELAKVAAFSPYHFHRLFSELMGEPLFACIRRLRLERAAGRLLANRDASITGIALDCGFSSSAVFAREFRRQFGVAASVWRAGGRKEGQTEGKECKTLRKRRKVSAAGLRYDAGGTAATGSDHERQGAIMKTAATQVTGQVTVQDLAGYRVAYLRHIGPYEHISINKVWDRLMQWAGPRGLAGGGTIGISHDDPGITPAAKLRYDACVVVGPEVKGEGEIGIQEIKAGKHAVCRVTCTPDQIKDAFHWLFAEWFPSSGWQCADGPCFERYAPECGSGTDAAGNPLFVFDICVPVQPL